MHCFLRPCDNLSFLFQRPDTVLPALQWEFRSTQSGPMLLSCPGSQLKTPVKTLRPDMSWSGRRWAPAPRSGCSASPLTRPHRWRSWATVSHVKQIIISVFAVLINTARATMWNSPEQST